MSNYFIATNGLDTNDGSILYPFKTWDKAHSILVPGDIVYFRGGVYNQYISINKSGLANAWIKLIAYDNEPAVIDGTGFNSSTVGTAICQVSGASFIEMNGLEAINSPEAGFGCQNECHNLNFINLYAHETAISGILCRADWIPTVIGKCSNILIDGCETYHTNILINQEGISLIGVSDFTVRNTLMRSQYHQAGIDCKCGTCNGKIYSNEFLDEVGGDVAYQRSGVYFDGGYGTLPVHDVEVNNNLFHDLRYGILLNSEAGDGTAEQHRLYNINVHHNEFRNINNLATGTGNTRAIGLWYAVTKPAMKQNIVIADNLFYDCMGGIQNTVPAAYYTGCQIVRNTFVKNSGSAEFITNYGDGTIGAGLQIDSNKFYANAFAANNVFGTNFIKGTPDEYTPAVPGLPSFGTGQATQATVPVTLKPANLACDLELFIGPDPATKLATSGKIRFTSTGANQNITAPITMPAAGATYHVYVDLWYGTLLVGSYISNQDINVIEGIIGPIIW